MISKNDELVVLPDWPICSCEVSREGEVSMKKTQYLDVITSIDVLNTVNGGVSEPQLNLIHHEDYREIRLWVAGIRLDDIHVEIHNNNLSIFYYINIICTDKMIQLPRFVYNRNVPYYIDISKIRARLEDNELVVSLPFNRLANGYHKEIKANGN
jgi:HSP20 family molecular chaperone IbpA